jgi:hypothetical protein
MSELNGRLQVLAMGAGQEVRQRSSSLLLPAIADQAHVTYTMTARPQGAAHVSSILN